MVTRQRSVTQVFREAQQGQLLEHVSLIQELEARVAGLESELTALRRTGGTQELQRLPTEVLDTLLKVFDVVPIPDLSAWERRQYVGRLSAALEELEQQSPADGGIAPGTWDSERPSVNVAEGDGRAVARVTREMVRTLGEAAAKYLGQMVEFQGTTPDHVSRARSAHLMDLSSLVDAKEQYGLLPAESQRELFEQHIDELARAKDQLITITRWMNEGRDITRTLLDRVGVAAERRASLLGLLTSLAEADGVAHQVSLRQGLHPLVARYAALLPTGEARAKLGLGDTDFQRSYADALSEESRLSFLAAALEAVLADHETALDALRDSAIKTRERAALKRLAKSHGASPAKARRALLRVVGSLSAVEDAVASLEATQKAVVKAYQFALEKQARERFAASPRPEAQGAAYERLSKVERTAFLAGIWQDLVTDLNTLASDPEASLAALDARAREASVQAVGVADPSRVDARRRALGVVAEALRDPPDDEANELSLSTPIDVEQGLLDRQVEDVEARVEAFFEKYSRSKKTGLGSIQDATTKLAEINALKKSKKAALDRLLKGSQRGCHSPKREAEAALALQEEQQAIDEGRDRIEARKRAAFAQVLPELEPYGLADAGDYDALLRRVEAELQRLDAAAEAALALEDARRRAQDLAGRLSPDGSASPQAALGFFGRVEADAARLRDLADAVQRSKGDYLDAANGVLRRRAADYGAARLALSEAESELDLAETLRVTVGSYVGGFSVFRGALGSLEKVRTWVRRERKKAKTLREEVAAGAESVAKAVGKLGQRDPGRRLS